MIGFHALDNSAFSALNCLLVLRDVVLGKDRFDRTFGDAERAVDAFVRVDHEEIRALAKAVDGADVHAIRIFAANAAFGDDVGHEDLLLDPFNCGTA